MSLIFAIIALINMTDSKDNSKKPESSQDENTQSPTKSAIKKDRLKFKKEDMYKIKYNF